MHVAVAVWCGATVVDGDNDAVAPTPQLVYHAAPAMHSLQFTAPRHQCRAQSFANADDKVRRLVESHPFQHQIHVITPTLQSTIDTRSVCHSGARVVDAPLCSVVHADYWAPVAAGGVSVYGMSLETPLSHCNTVAIVPSSQTQPRSHTLRLRVDRDTYEQLGLTGTKLGGDSHGYDICIPMDAKQWHSGNKSYERVMQTLSPTRGLSPVTLVMMAVNGNDGECVSLPPLTDALRFDSIDTEHSEWSMTNAWTPNLATVFSDNDSLSDRDAVNEVSEWLGLCALRLTTALDASKVTVTDDLLSASQTLSLSATTGPLSSSRATGFFAPSHVLRVFNEARAVIGSDPVMVPWAVIYLSGFDDASVSFGDRAHSCDVSEGNGENHYAIIVLPDHRAVVLQFLNEADVTR